MCGQGIGIAGVSFIGISLGMKFHLFWRFVRYLKPYWGKELILLLLMILTSIGTLVSPYVLKIIIDTVFPARDYSLLIQILLLLLGVNILRLMIGYLSDGLAIILPGIYGWTYLAISCSYRFLFSTKVKPVIWYTG